VKILLKLVNEIKDITKIEVTQTGTSFLDDGVDRQTDRQTDRQRQTDTRRSEVFEMWIRRRMEKISWLDKVTNKEVLRRVNEDRQILNSMWQRKHQWIGHVLRHDGYLHEVTEGRKKGKPTRGRRRFQMLHDLANDDGYVALKWASEDRDGWRHKERMSKTCCTSEDY